MSKGKYIVLLIGAALFAYLSSLGNPFIWDDEQFITANQFVQTFDVQKIFTTNTVAGAGIRSNYYRPLTTLSFAIDAKIWGSSTFGFHLINVSFHIGAGILLFLLLLELGLMPVVGFFLGLFFLVHPIQTEAVTYINSRGDSMYAFFLFASLLLFAKQLSFRKQAKQNLPMLSMLFSHQTIVIGLAVVFLFLLGLLSKEIALAGAGLFAAIALFRNGWKGLKNKRVLMVISGIILIIVVYFWLRLNVLNFNNTLNFYGFENTYTQNLAIRLFTFCKVVWTYIWLLLWPYPLHMERYTAFVDSFFSPWVLSILALFTGIIGLGIGEIKKMHTRWILFGLFWFLSMLVPSSGIIPINGILYEHWLYVPMVGFFLMLYGLARFFLLLLGQQRPIIKPAIMQKILISFGTLLAILYIVLTIRQNNIWSDPIGFYTYTLSFTPQSARLHNNLGMSLDDIGKEDAAIREYKQALVITHDIYPEVHNNLANIYRNKGMYDRAEEEYKKALAIAPTFFMGRVNLIKLYVFIKQFDKAREVAHNYPQLLEEINKVQSVSNEHK